MHIAGKAVIGIGALVVCVAVAYALFLRPETPADSVDMADTGGRTASSTGLAPRTNNRTLPPEPVFTLPEGASAVDEYAFIADGDVFFRSVTSTTSLPIPGADADTFHAISDIITYPGERIAADCGGAGAYSYYEDNKYVYFHQIWRTPRFRTSQVEVIADVDPDEFDVQEAPYARADGQRIVVKYHVSTSTCLFVLERLGFMLQ